MAIDSRIALNLQPLNVGQRFGQNIQNLQQVDLLNQRRDIAPLQLQQAQRANELVLHNNQHNYRRLSLRLVLKVSK